MLDQRDALGGDVGRLHVGQAVDDIDGGIDLSEVIANGFMHTAIAREPEIHDRHVQPPPEDASVYHAWAAGAGSMGDAGAVKNDRLLTWSEAFKFAAFGDADAKEFDAVVER